MSADNKKKSPELESAVKRARAFEGVIAVSPQMRTVLLALDHLAASSRPALISGEPGTGRSYLAHRLHAASQPEGPAVAIRVGQMAPQVLSDTLYGGAGGAPGIIQQAKGGSLILEELGNLEPAAWRVLQPLLRDKDNRLQVRFLATAQALRAESAIAPALRDGFQERQVYVPALRERWEDLPLLLRQFFEESASDLGRRVPTPPDELIPLLRTHSFPGNLRELKVMVHEAVRQHESRKLSLDVFKVHLGRNAPPADRHPDGLISFTGERLPTVREATNALIAEAMKRSGGNQSIAASILGISRPTLSKRLKRERRD